MIGSKIPEAIDTWTVMAVLASQFLTGFYRRLGDDKQASCAIKAGTQAEERAARLNLHPRLMVERGGFLKEHTVEEDRESRAWSLLVECNAGLLGFYAMVAQNAEKAKSVRSQHAATSKTLGVCLRGFRIAFPAEFVEGWILEALERATSTSVEAFIHDLEKVPEEDQATLRAGLHEEVMAALNRMALSESA